jgi:hypothetical protein
MSALVAVGSNRFPVNLIDVPQPPHSRREFFASECGRSEMRLSYSKDHKQNAQTMQKMLLTVAETAHCGTTDA